MSIQENHLTKGLYPIFRQDSYQTLIKIELKFFFQNFYMNV